MPPPERPLEGTASPDQPPADDYLEELQTLLREAAMNEEKKETLVPSSPDTTGAQDTGQTGMDPATGNGQPPAKGTLQEGTTRSDEHSDLNIGTADVQSIAVGSSGEGDGSGKETSEEDKNYAVHVAVKTKKAATASYGFFRRETRENEKHIIKAMISGSVLLFVMWNIPDLSHTLSIIIAGFVAGFVARNELSAAVASLLPVFFYQIALVAYNSVMKQPGREMLKPIVALEENPYMGEVASGMVGIRIPLFLLYFAMALAGSIVASTFADIVHNGPKKERKDNK